LNLNRITSLNLDDYVDCDDRDNEGDVNEKDDDDDDGDDDDGDDGILIISPFFTTPFSSYRCVHY
jgi:hypothetical protein